jgi:hypothetical protein
MNNKRDELIGKILFAMIGLTFFGVGLLSVITEYAPARSTKYGMAEALMGSDAVQFGLHVMSLGVLAMLPLFPKKLFWIVVPLLVGFNVLVIIL